MAKANQYLKSSAGYEQKYSQNAVKDRLKVFPKLEKHLIIEFENKKPISDIVRENEKYTMNYPMM